MRPSLIQQVAAGLVFIAAAGCTGSRGSGPPPPSFTLTVNPNALSVPAGGGGSVGVTVARTGGFTDSVTLSLNGAPPGVLGSGLVAAGAQTGILSLRVGSDVMAQNLDALRVKGTAGNLSQVTAFQLVVAPPLPVGQIRADLVQASGGTQWGGALENTGVALEPIPAKPAKDASGTVEVRHDFIPSVQFN